jgi:DNA-binding transcriptional ArsR family regulator
MGALGTASRVRLLAHLRQGDTTVGDLAEAVQMEQPAVSHQLRVLRDAGFVVGTRHGRHTVYSLYDSHVTALIDEMLGHLDHVRAGATETFPTSDRPQPNHAGDTMSDHQDHDHAEAHVHEHSHDDTVHAHAHTDHDHPHVTHDHEHPAGDDSHAHPHVHQAGLESEHAH